jgi:glyoxylase-like metal-dependent hydrolase (beta-lactamase superfamily II)
MTDVRQPRADGGISGVRLPASAVRWKVGAVTITKVVELDTVGGTRFVLPQASREEIRAIDWLFPHFADENGRLKMTIHSLVVETPTRRILVDTGLGNDKQNRAVPTWNFRQGSFLEDLAAAGYPPETIDTVLCTHLHVDHVGWNTRLVDGRWVPTFPNARYVMNRSELEYWRNRRDGPAHVAVFEDSILPVVEAGMVDLVDGDHRLCEEMRLIPTPGHSPAHMSVGLRSRGETALLTGDVLHHPCQMAHLDWASSVDFDAEQSTRTRRELFSRLAETPTLIIGGHFAAGRVLRDRDAFRLEV